MGEPESLATDEALATHVDRHAIDRLVMLSDGVFAIAITLAALEIHIPTAPDVGGVIAAMGVNLFAYLISFCVIAVFWTSNRDLFARLRRVDRVLTALVLATLCLNALIPASVRISGPRTGGLGGAFQFYALVMTLSGALNCLLWVYAGWQRGLMSPEVTRAYRVRRIVETGTLPLLFAAILAVRTVAMLKWIGVVALATIGARRLLLRRLGP